MDHCVPFKILFTKKLVFLVNSILKGTQWSMWIAIWYEKCFLFYFRVSFQRKNLARRLQYLLKGFNFNFSDCYSCESHFLASVTGLDPVEPAYDDIKSKDTSLCWETFEPQTDSSIASTGSSGSCVGNCYVSAYKYKGQI